MRGELCVDVCVSAVCVIMIRRPDMVFINKNKRTWYLMDFAISERKDRQILGSCSRAEKPEGDSNVNCRWRAFNVPKDTKKRLEELETRGRMEGTQPTALLRSATIRRKVLETSVDFLSLTLHKKKKTLAKVGVKKLQETKYHHHYYYCCIIIIIKVTVVWVVVGTFGTVCKGLEKTLGELEIRGRVETLPTAGILN